VLFHAWFEELGGHERGQGQGHDAGNGHGPGQGKGELAEQGAGQSALQPDGRIDRGQGDGHGHKRPDQLARAKNGGVQRRLTFGNVALHILNDHDGVIDHKSHGQHHGQEREQVHREPEYLHQKHGAYQGQRDGDDRNGHGPKGTHEQKNDDDDDKQRVTQGP
jgi:hypothetical protein